MDIYFLLNLRMSRTNTSATAKLYGTGLRSIFNKRKTGRVAPDLSVLDNNAFDDIGYVFATVGHGFQQFINGFEFDQVAYVRLFTEQFGHRRAHDVIGIRFQAIYFLADGQDFTRVIHVVQQLSLIHI